MQNLARCGRRQEATDNPVEHVTLGTVALHGTERHGDGARRCDPTREAFASDVEDRHLTGTHGRDDAASIGIIAPEPTNTTLDALIRAADAGLYEAKAEGRGRWSVAR